MFDTNILIYLMKNKPPFVAERVNAPSSEAQLCMSFFTFAELLMGAERSTRKPDVLRRLGALSRVVPAHYGANRTIRDRYAVLFTQLRSAETLIGANNLWIAIHALADDCTLLTNNLREFKRIEGLRLENWAESA